MATRLTVNGVSTTITPDTEQYERFMSAHRGKRILFYLVPPTALYFVPWQRL